MKFLVPNWSCLQNPWLVGYRPQILSLSLSSVLNWIFWNPPPRTKFLGTPLSMSLLNPEQWKLWPKEFGRNLHAELRCFSVRFGSNHFWKIWMVFAYFWRRRKSAQGISWCCFSRKSDDIYDCTVRDHETWTATHIFEPTVPTYKLLSWWLTFIIERCMESALLN